MLKIISLVSQAVEWISNCFFKISVVAIFFLVIDVSFNVFTRYFLNEPMEWAEEIGSYIFTLLVFFGFAEMARKDLHIKVEFIAQSLFSRKGVTFIRIFSFIIGIIWCALVAKESWNTVWNAYRYDMVSLTQLKFPLFISYSFLALGLSILFVQLLVLLIKEVKIVYSH
jgi:TRAP-type C4-dicarboxylate transport system permease small subunit